MFKMRGFVRWLVIPLAAMASFAGGSPAPTTAQMSAAVLSHLNLSHTQAGVASALLPLSTGARASAKRVNAAQAAATVDGTSSSRAVVALGDVDDDKAADLLDLRASGGTLTYSVISGARGTTIWRNTIERPTTVYAAAFPAKIRANDVYVLEQYEANGSFNYTVHAVGGADGKDFWTVSGSLPVGAQTTPQVPPTLPPVGVPSNLPTAIPSPSCSVPAVPAPEVPSPGVPNVDPSNLPTVDPSNLPSVPPTGLPTPPDTSCITSLIPTAVPTAVPSDPTTLVPTAVPTALPSGLPVPVPSGTPTAVPSEAPSNLPVDPSTIVPSALPTPTGSPSAPVPLPSPTITPPVPASAHGRSARAPKAPGATIATPFAAYALGSVPVDVDKDGFQDFPLTVYYGLDTAQTGPIVAANLMTLGATAGAPVGSVTAVGKGAIPYAGVSGDFAGTGSTGLFVADEISAESAGEVVTMRAFTRTGSPLWAAVANYVPATIGIYDATSDLTGDGMADVLADRISVQPGAIPSTVSVRSSPLGQPVWSQSYQDTSIGYVVPSIDDTAGSDVLVQGIVGLADGKIPSGVAYRALAGGTGTAIYSGQVAFPYAGADGDWSATLTPDAGDLNGDGIDDAAHGLLVVPNDKPLTWSQTAVNVHAGAILWTHQDDPPALPVFGSLNTDKNSDLVALAESASRYTDTVIVKARDGSNGLTAWATRVAIGGGSERIKSISVLGADLSGTGVCDVVITAIQRSGDQTRSIIAAVRGTGTGGRVLWLRTF